MKHYNVKILMTALLSTAFSLAAGAQGYYAYATGDYTSIDINTDINPSTADNISVVYGGFNDTETPANSDTYKTGTNRGEGSFTANDKSPFFTYYCKGNGVTPKNKNGYNYNTTNKLPPVKGTFYVLKPSLAGVARVYVTANTETEAKTLWICEKTGDEQITPVAEYSSGNVIDKQASRSYLSYQFNVKASTEYYVFTNGHALGFAGFVYTTDAQKLDESVAYNKSTSAGAKAFQLMRSFVKDKWNTLCIPCTLTVANCRHLFGAEVEMENNSKSADVSGNGFKFTTNSSILPGRVYLVKPKVEVVNPLIVSTITEDNEVSRGSEDYGYFKGSYSPFDMTAGDNTIYFLTAAQTLSTPLTDGQMKGYRCYFKMPSTSSARPMIVFDDGETTDISELLAPQEQIANSVIYNLNGQRMSSMSSELPSGIYIVNGKKVFIK